VREHATTPIGLVLSRAAKTASRAFDDALVAAGGSLPVWLIMLALKTKKPPNQRELAAEVGIQGATLTHHLNAMEADGLITRERDPDNRRIHRVALTTTGEALFLHLATAAQTHDRRLRTGLTATDIATLTDLLTRLRNNVTSTQP
jgi:MarR family transcriptional regulator for hemolysin